MDFSNERYVRLYTRDTTGWKLLRWQGQTVWTLLYRKADRAGVVNLDGLEPWEAVALHCDLPEEVAQPGMQRCLDRGWIVRDGDRLVFPKFIEANETPMSDAQRARDSRAKRAALVTNRDAPSQNVTAPSQNVTECHTESRGVTRSHTASLLTTPSTPCLTTPTQIARAHEEQAPFQCEDFGGGRLSRAAPEKTPSLAARGAAWLAAAISQEPFSHSGKWADALAEIAAKPEHELGTALNTLASESGRMSDPKAVLHPNHVRDYWHLYSQGKAPGKKPTNAPAPGNTAALQTVLKQLAAAREKAERAGPDSWERTQAQNEIADLEGRANRLRAS